MRGRREGRLLEFNQVPYGHIKGVGNANEHVDAHIGRSYLDFPEIGAARACHERELALRDATAGPLGDDSGPESPLLLCVVHSASIWAL